MGEDAFLDAMMEDRISGFSGYGMDDFDGPREDRDDYDEPPEDTDEDWPEDEDE